MHATGPGILVVDDDGRERKLIASLLHEAGFAVAAVGSDTDALATIDEREFAAVVIALRNGGEVLLRRCRRRQARLKALVVIDPAAMPPAEDNGVTLIKRPFDARQLLGCVFALVLREEEHVGVTGHGHAAAELGIAAAKLVCLQNRRIAAAAAGASRLAQELTRQISETAALHQGLPAAG